MSTLYTVYKTTNTLDRRFYIGVHKTANPNDSYLGSGLRLTAAIKKHGRKVFQKEILFAFETSKEAYAKEKELVTKELIESGEVYNLATGGVPSIEWLNGERKKTLRGTIQTEEANRKRAESHRNLPKIKCSCGREISPSNYQRHVASHLV